MGDARIYVTRRLPEVAMRILEQAGAVKVWTEDLPPPREVLEAEIAEVEGLLCLLTDVVDEMLLCRARKLKVVSNMAVGYDNIDVGACTARGILVTNTPGVLTETTADLTFALLLGVARRITEAERFLRAGQWETWSPMLLAGQDVYGAIIGIVGMGRIGQAVARRARGFDMQILYASRSAHPEVERTLGARRVQLEELLRNSDFVTLHVPLTPETRGLVGERELRLMKSTAILINTARGPVVDEVALVRALREGWIAGAGLDVYAQEPIAADHPLLKLDNVVLLPHIGSASVKTRTRMAVMAAENLVAALAGQLPHSVVNPEAWGDRGRP